MEEQAELEYESTSWKTRQVFDHTKMTSTDKHGDRRKLLKLETFYWP